MIDLTPLDVRKKRGDFRRLLRGYDPEEVDTFMDLVAERFEELVRENLRLSEKTDRLEVQVQALEGREHAVQEALVTAQKLREDVRSQTQRDADVLNTQSRREAELLKAEADAEIGRRLGEAEGLILERQRALEELERSRLKFLKSFRGLLERELDAVEVEESRRPLEDVPLELELRGWMPGGSEDGEAEAEAELETDPEAEAEAELETDLEAVVEDEFGTEVIAEAEPEPEEEVTFDEAPPEVGEFVDFPEAEVTQEDQESGEAEPTEGIPDGFETQVLEGASPTGPMVDSDDAPPVKDKKSSSSSQEPKWLFSLLKKENEERGGEG